MMAGKATYKYPTVCLDFDDTLAMNKWPSWPSSEEWFSGSVAACHKLHQAGVRLVVASTRLHPMSFYDWPVRTPRPLHEVAFDEQKMREVLDSKGLTFVEVYNERGKCPADVYVDDKAIWYPGRDKSWDRLVPVILERVGLDGGDYID